MLWMILLAAIFWIFAYHRASLINWTIILTIYLLLFTSFHHMTVAGKIILWSVFIIIAAILNIRPLRRLLISRYLFKAFSRVSPSLSSTEKQALLAGTVNWDAELFSGMPDWDKCLSFPAASLTAEEQAFLDGPVEELCDMIDNWDITHNRFDLPPEMWDFLKYHGFFGIIIPKEYGGKDFSAAAHSSILTKLAGKSMSVASVVAVPNSLGPAELLLKYGSEEHRRYYLPRLAKGEEIPCFALTGPEAGSDAGSMPDYGVVTRGYFEGKEIIGIRLNWNKRYITLAPIATVLGLAFKLYDPDHLIGETVSIGITCALIPTGLAGITIGRRHCPLNCAFPNGPTSGKDVFIPLEYIIGGVERAGQGWKMLVECLAAGRAISLPSMATGGSKIAAYTSGAYARIRTQFHSPIGKFGGIEEVLARIAGHTYIMDATRKFTVAAVDRGEKPAVPAAISKYHLTELGRKVINDAMDLHGGKGICMGPKNYLAINYQETPISITVEGANILTRSMIIFGQGAIRCHPYVLKEIESLQMDDSKKALAQFDKAIFAHAGFLLSNTIRSFILGISHGLFGSYPKNTQLKRYYQHLTRFSSALAFVSDISMMSLGGSLKRREKLSARLGDVLSMLYLGSAVLKQFHEHSYPPEELPIVEWACQSILYTAQKQLYGVLTNFPNKILGRIIRMWVFPLGKQFTESRDRLGHLIAKSMLEPNSVRSMLAEGAFLKVSKSNPQGYMEKVLKAVIAVEEIEHRLYHAVHKKEIDGLTKEQQINAAIKKGIMTEQEAQQLREALELRKEIIAVDDFAFAELSRTHATEKTEDQHLSNVALM